MQKTNEDLVSIIMPNYNGARYIGQAIESVIAQTYQNWELLITDDASSDNSVEIIKGYQNKDRRIFLFIHEKRMNAANTRNTSIEHSRGRYIAFLDADDCWETEKLKKQIEFMVTNKICFCCHSYQQIDANGNLFETVIDPPVRINYKKCLELSNPIGNLTAVYDREALGTIKSPDIERRNDFAMWLQILKKTEFCYGMPEVLAYHRVGVKNSISKNKIQLIPYHWKLYYNIEQLGFLRSLYYMFCWVLIKGIKKRRES